MAVRFENLETAYIESAVVTAFPFTMACWFIAYSYGSNYPCMWIGDRTSDTYACRLETRAGVAQNWRARIERHATGSSRNAFAAPFTEDIWQYGAGVFDGPNSLTAYLNGVAGAENINLSGVPAGYNRTAVGAMMGLTPYYGGMTDIAYAAIWSVAQTPAVIADLATGMSPLAYPDGLEAFWPLGGEYGENYLDRSGNGYDLTAQGTPTFVADPSLLPYWLPLAVSKAQVFGW